MNLRERFCAACKGVWYIEYIAGQERKQLFCPWCGIKFDHFESKDGEA